MKYKDLFERSNSYQFTYDPRDPDDSLAHDIWTEKVKKLGTHRIVRMPRLGKNNPNAALYQKSLYGPFIDYSPEEAPVYLRARVLTRPAGPLASSSTIHKEHGSRIDVYAYPKRRWGNMTIPNWKED